MSFSGNIKDEISRQIPEESHCLRAEIAAIIQFAGHVCREPGKKSVSIETENVALAKKYLRLIKKAFAIQVDLEIRRRSAGKNHLYSIFIGEQKEAGRVIAEAVVEDCHEICKKIFVGNCCRRAFIRGAFLAAGSMSDPAKSYHLEIVCRREEIAKELAAVIAVYHIPAKIAGRKGKFIVYIKDSTGIVDLLNVMEAHKSLMELENIRIIKDMRNCANRQYNCDSANINKMVQAAARQLEDIHYIEQNMGLDKLNAPLREMAMVRLEHPEVSLQEVGTYLNPPVGKSGVNHRLRKLGEIADDLRRERESCDG
ncbi:MAG: DNA-binding protein WhiA [Eubacterium sp.]